MAVLWYLRDGLSYRDVEELLAERGVDVDHVTIYRRVQTFTRLIIDVFVSSDEHVAAATKFFERMLAGRDRRCRYELGVEARQRSTNATVPLCASSFEFPVDRAEPGCSHVISLLCGERAIFNDGGLKRELSEAELIRRRVRPRRRWIALLGDC